MITKCRSCGRSTLLSILDLGELYVPEFSTSRTMPPKHPLHLMRCANCNLVQLGDTVPREDVYHDGYGFYSGVNERTTSELNDIVTDVLRYKQPGGRWLDIGCNDGTLLSFVPTAFHRVGVDPVAKFGKLADRHADEVHVELFDPETFTEPFDVISSIAMFYDLDDPSAFVEGIASILKPDGIWVVQQNDLESMIETNAVDNISHEHLTYWSERSFDHLIDRCGLKVIASTYSDLNGGCMRTFVQHKGGMIGRGATAVRFHARLNLNDPQIYHTFTDRARRVLGDLSDLVYNISRANERVHIYGASNRGNTLWQCAAGVPENVEYVVERNPDKVGLDFTSIGVPIISEEEMRADPPDYLLIGPWWFGSLFAKREREFLKKGGALILPLPEVRIITL